MSDKILVLGNCTEWCDIVYHDLNDESVTFNNTNFIERMNFFTRAFYKLKTSRRIRMFHNSKMISYVLSSFFKKKCQQFSKIIIFDWNPLCFDDWFLYFFKKRGIEIGIIFTNLYIKSGLHTFKKDYLLDKFYDEIFYFDKNDLKRPELKKIPYSFSTKFVLSLCGQGDIIYDVFFIGNAKDRFSIVLRIYEKMVASGLKCLFIVNGIDTNEQIENGMIYNKYISYKEVLGFSSKSRCILEILQNGGSTSTLRIMEAISLNKYFLTNNYSISDDSIFDTNHMFVISEKYDFSRFKETIIEKFNYSNFYKQQISIDNLKKTLMEGK